MYTKIKQWKVFSYLIFFFIACFLSSCTIRFEIGSQPTSLGTPSSDFPISESPISESPIQEKLESISLVLSKNEIKVGESIELSAITVPSSYQEDVVFEVEQDENYVRMDRNILTALKQGTSMIFASAGGTRCEGVQIRVIEEPVQIQIMASSTSLRPQESATLSAVTTPSGREQEVEYVIIEGSHLGTLNGNVFTAGNGAGTVVIEGRIAEYVSNPISLQITEETTADFTITASNTVILEGDSITLSYDASANVSSVSYCAISHAELVYISGNQLRARSAGIAQIQANSNGKKSNIIEITILALEEDPYKNVSEASFYLNYTPAESIEDAVYRTYHSFLSGENASQDQAPTLSKNAPKNGNQYVKNSSAYYDHGGSSYHVVNENGEKVSTIYKGAAYITLEDVAAYVYAFGDVPANYVEDKKASPRTSPWGEYLRVNHSSFSGSTTYYPYEPVLPRISGCGGDLKYYEIDIGTTGTDCDPNYTIGEYNNGSSILRGAARIVYSRFYDDDSPIYSLDDRYVFYTYNHYNDFQEYLNYQYGWGEMFGNVTGGGTLSSKTDYNPTPYVPVTKREF